MSIALSVRYERGEFENGGHWEVSESFTADLFLSKKNAAYNKAQSIKNFAVPSAIRSTKNRIELTLIPLQHPPTALHDLLLT